jgi:hypothetical protein
LKWIEPVLRVAEYNFTGMATSPKETVSDAIDLAAMKNALPLMQQVPAPLPASLGVKYDPVP